MESKTKNAVCKFKVEGMHCPACELLIEKEAKKVEGVIAVDAKLGNASVELDLKANADAATVMAEINQLVGKYGYRLAGEGGRERESINWKELGLSALIAGVFVGLFLLLEKLGVANLLNFEGGLTYPQVFVIGIIASLSTCMAVVGGLVLTISSNFAQGGKTMPLMTFHISRIVSFFIFGGIVGAVGSLLKLSPQFNLLLQFTLFLVMFVMGMSQLRVLPFFDKFQLRAPKSLGKKVDTLSKLSGALIPTLLGAATFILPCGFTQSMQYAAFASGSFLNGALIMFVFALGTFPVLGLISFASVKLATGLNSGLFFKTVGFLIIFFALINLYGVIQGLRFL